jgi:adenylate cyclase
MTALDASIARTRLGAGVVLFAYVSTHLLNHCLGNISLAAMESGRFVFLGLWRNPVGTTLLYGALSVHILLVLYSLFRRRTLRLPRHEAIQVIFGLSIPPLLVTHLVGTRIVHEQADLNDIYAYVLYSHWIGDPLQVPVQMTALAVAWTHGCIGLHTWLKLRPWYRRWEPYAYAIAIALPLGALAGYASGGREVEYLMRDPIWRERTNATINWPASDMMVWAYDVRDFSLWTIAATLAVVFGGRWARLLWERAHPRIKVIYPDGRVLQVVPGLTLLEISRAHGIPHASVCGGRGRCSTCRVRINMGLDGLEPMAETEAKVLERVGMPEGVRLACQIRPSQDLAITPLLPSAAQASDGFRRDAHLAGGEREIAVLFADIRGFTSFSEKKLPFDLVFVMNQYFRSMGMAVERSGGQVDKFIGDGVMALFGVGKSSAQGARDAINAARAMIQALETLNDTLMHDLDKPLKIGIGIHAGPAIVGEMGYSRATTLTAMGDTVNTASRLESMTKDLGAALVVSQHTADLARIDLTRFPRHALSVRGRAEPLGVYAIANVLDLEELPPIDERAPGLGVVDATSNRPA